MLTDPHFDVFEGSTRGEYGAHSCLVEGRNVFVWNNPAAKDHDVPRVALAQGLDDAWEQGEVRPGERRQADAVDVLIDGCLGDLIRGLMEPRVDDLTPGIA